MRTGGQVTIVQPVDSRLANGMAIRVEGSGDTARVVPARRLTACCSQRLRCTAAACLTQQDAG